MIWKICFILSQLSVFTAILLFLRQYKWKRAKFSSSVRILIVGFAIGLFALILPIQIDAFGSDFASVVKAVLVSLNRTLRGFVLTDINFMNGTQSIEPDFYGIYSVTMTLLCFFCPFLTLSYILSFFAKIRASVRTAFSHRKKLFVFSELNESSLALAQDLSAQHKDRRIIFCGVDNSFKGSSLVHSADKLGAICMSRGIRALALNAHSKKKDIYFFTISADEQQNTSDALALLEQYRSRDLTRIYLFSALPESELILTGTDPGRVKLRRIDTKRCLIDRYLYDEGEILFRGAVGEKGNRQIRVLIAGLGNCGEEMLRALCWYCQMDGYQLTIDAFDLSPDAAEHLRLKCPDLLNPQYNGVHIPGEAAYTIRIHPGIDICSAVFYDELNALDPPTFVFVALGDDSADIAVSAELRMRLARRGVHPTICTVVKNSEKKRMVSTIESIRGQQYDILPIGDLHDTYSEKEILHSELESEALRLHLQWGDEASFWRYEYNYSSSISRAIHLKLRRSLSVHDPYFPDGSAQITEHRRWNAYMRSMGYIYSGSPDPASRDDLAKLHQNLVPYDQLSESDRAKDSST